MSKKKFERLQRSVSETSKQYDLLHELWRCRRKDWKGQNGMKLADSMHTESSERLMFNFFIEIKRLISNP